MKLNWKLLCVNCGGVQWAEIACDSDDERIRRCVGICSDCFAAYQKYMSEVEAGGETRGFRKWLKDEFFTEI